MPAATCLPPGKSYRYFRIRTRALVEGVNIRKKHQRPSETDQGGIVDKAASIHISNLMLLTADDQPTRVGRKEDENGKLVRFGKRDGNILK